MLKHTAWSNTGSDTLTRDPTRSKSLTRWPSDPWPGSISWFTGRACMDTGVVLDTRRPVDTGSMCIDLYYSM